KAEYIIYDPEEIEEKDLSDLDLTGTDLSDTAWLGCKFPENLEKTKFDRSCLSMCDLRKVHAAGASFVEADLCFTRLEEVNLQDSDLSQADFSYAVLNRGNLTDAKTLGTIWIEADLSEIIAGSQLVKQQEEQQKILGDYQQQLMKLQQKQNQQHAILIAT